MQNLDQKIGDCGCGKPKYEGTAGALVDAQIRCMACDHSSKVSVPLVEAPDPVLHGIFRCDECGARMAYGKLLMREVVEPYEDERGVRWLRRRFQDPKTKKDVYVVDVDPQFAAMAARDVLALVIP